MKPGDRCPRCLKGKIYEQKGPALCIRVVVPPTPPREVLYNDDTAMKILALARASPHSVPGEQETSSSRERTGQFTSGIVSTREGQRIALSVTGRKHAGENLAQVLVHRVPALAPPIQMCSHGPLAHQES